MGTVGNAEQWNGSNGRTGEDRIGAERPDEERQQRSNGLEWTVEALRGEMRNGRSGLIMKGEDWRRNAGKGRSG